MLDGGDENMEGIVEVLWQTEDLSVIKVFEKAPSMRGWYSQALKLRDLELPRDLLKVLFADAVYWKLQGSH